MAVTEYRVPKLASRIPEEIDEMIEYSRDKTPKQHPGKS
jgi:hypothetical protein